MGVLDAFCAPFNMSKLRVKMGEFNIKQARGFFSEGKLMEGFITLRAGVARAPDNLDARRSLAGLYLAALRKPADAAKILEARIQEAFDKKDAEYIAQTSLTFAMAGEYAQKAHLLAIKALENKIIDQEKAKNIFKAIFANEMPAKPKIKGFAASAQKLGNFADAKQYAAKCAALLMLREGEVEEAAKMLEENNISGGEIFSQVKMRELFEEGREIEALQMAKTILASTKTPSHTYLLAKKIHDEFGNQDEAAHAKKMAYLTDNSRNAAEIFSAVQNDDANKLEIIIDRDKMALATAIKIAIDLKNETILHACQKALPRMHEPLKTKLGLAIFEAMFIAGKTADAEQILAQAKSHKNPPEIDDIIADMSLAAAMRRGENTEQALRLFKKRNSPQKMGAFAEMLLNAKMRANALEIIEMAREKSGDGAFLYQTEVKCLYEMGDFAGAARAISKTNKRCPNKILCDQNMREYASDKFIMMSGAERDCFAKKVEEAEKKLKEYKALNNF